MEGWLEFALRDAGGADSMEEESMAGDLPDEASLEGQPEPEVEVPGAWKHLALATLVPWRPLPAQASDVSDHEIRDLVEVRLAPFCTAPLRRVCDAIAPLEAPSEDQALAEVDDISRLAARFLTTEEGHVTMMTKRALASNMDLAERDVEPKLCRLACVLAHCDRSALQSFGECLRAQAAALCMYCEFAKYDATTMRVTVRPQVAGHAADGAQSSASALVDSMAQSPGESMSLPRSEEFLSDEKVSQATSFLGGEHSFLMLAKVGHSERSRLVLFFGNVSAWNQLVDRTTGETLAAAISEVTPTPIVAENFEMKVRCSTTDAAASNFRAERWFSTRRDGWKFIHLACNIHRVARGHTRTFELVGEAISGMVNFSISVSTASSMSHLRQAFALVVDKDLVVLRGAPPVANREFQSLVLSMFLQRGRRCHERRAALQQVMNGDWQKQGVVEVYIGGEGPVTQEIRKQVRRQVVRCIMVALLGRSFSTYPRHRWTGADLACDEVSLCAAVHGILFPAYQIFLTRFAKPSAPPATSSMLTDGPAWGDESALPIAGDQLGAIAADVPSRGDEGPSTWSETHARCRRVAGERLGSKPRHTMLAIRTVLEPWRP